PSGPENAKSSGAFPAFQLGTSDGRCKTEGPCSHTPSVVRLQSFARSMYSPVFGFTRTRSPVAMNSGTLIVTPFSSTAGFELAVFVAVFITGAVSVIVRFRNCGSCTDIG